MRTIADHIYRAALWIEGPGFIWVTAFMFFAFGFAMGGAVELQMMGAP